MSQHPTMGITMLKPSGYILYRGPSLLDGAPIVAIATLKSDNRKTGDMVQTWILRADLKPTEASKAGADSSVCGDCKHRWSLGGACYVNLGQGPRTVWMAYNQGKYPIADASQARQIGLGRAVRLGAYGDPAAVPSSVWQALTSACSGHTGYTHQWRNPVAAVLKHSCMASVDTPEEQAEAQSMDWRTFRVRCADDPLMAGEFECVADTKGTSCADCLACDGATAGRARKASVAIVVHGSLKSRFVASTQHQPFVG